MSLSRKLLIVTIILSPFIMYIIYGTDLISPKAEYVRLKNGTEFHDVSIRRTSDIDFYIDGNHYTEFDIDSLAW
jgi:hypothetical protein